MGRPGKNAGRMRKRRLEESNKEKNARLEVNVKRNKLTLSQETLDQRNERLSRMRHYNNNKLSQEANEQRGNRLGLIKERLSKETEEQRAHRFNVIKEILSNETEEQRAHRFSVLKEKLSNETEEQRAHRFSVLRERLSNESEEQRAHRFSVLKERLSNETEEQRAHRFSVLRERISNETEEQRAHRFSLIRERLSNETEDERSLRLDAARNRTALAVLQESPAERTNRINVTRRAASKQRNHFDIQNFKKAIDVYADLPCSICKKNLYPQQRCKLRTTNLGSILPEELVVLGNVTTCSRCSNNVKKHNTPPQAYWNNMSVTAIPPEIDALSEIEKRFLSRVVPFLKIIKVQNRFSQEWCKGQAIIFAQDVVELAEQLPLEPVQTGLVLVVENLENIGRSREFQIDMSKLRLALQWLLTNNALYKDVRLHFPTVIDISNITQIADEPAYANEETIAERSSVPTNKYISISDSVSILHGSFHQGNERFSPESRGRQCTGIATVASVAFSLINPNTWFKSDIDYILLVGDKYYKDCIKARANPNSREAYIEYLAATELLPNITYNSRRVDIDICHESTYNGHVDNDNSEEGYPNLINALINLFTQYKYAILTLNNATVAVHCRQEPEGISYWLFDSHARGPKGVKAPARGASCCIRFTSIVELHNIVRRNLYIKNTSANVLTLNAFSLTPITIASEIQIEPLQQIIETSSNLQDNEEQSKSVPINKYTVLSESVSILHGSFDQSNERFSPASRGRQCTGIATVASVACSLVNPNTWSKSDIYYILLVGDKYYKDCIMSRVNPNPREAYIEYLAATELLPNITYNNHKVNIDICYESAYNGHVDNDNSEVGFPNLLNALLNLFTQDSYAILTMNNATVAVHCRPEPQSITYWLFDSHARGPKGLKAPARGSSCCIRSTNIIELHDIVRHNLYNTNTSVDLLTLNTFSLTPLRITSKNQIEPLQQFKETSLDLRKGHQLYFQQPHDPHASVIVQQSAQESVIDRTKLFQLPGEENILHSISQQNTDTRYIFTTSMLRSIDESVPGLDSVVNVEKTNSEEEVRLQEVRRKTAPPLKFERERRIEELGWYFLFPDGKNGFGEERQVPITPLDYFQARVMSYHKRFHRNDYLFFALSVVEYYRAKASISVSCRMRQGQGELTPQGLIDNMHLTMRNVRGSASYWRRCCSELIAMVRNIGPPTWFMTFSCNDLYWPDMIKALLIAGGRDIDDVHCITFPERLNLVQKYPVVVARQFTIRVNALMRYLKYNNDCLGGSILDFWYRIEFQNRGSPHLHMLVWCENIPDFSTNEGIRVIEKIISCSLNPDDSELCNIVKNVQIHSHTNTCYKDRTNQCCRFGFPRAPSESTLCLGPDEALSNNGRFCILRRTPEETMVNNYSPDILSVWEGNMDIQPCGNISAVAYYVAKYASKCEPHDTGDVVREAIIKAKRRGGTVWSQLFAVSMAILSQRLVSAPECAYRLCHLPLKMSSRKTIFVNSCMPNQRFRLLRFEGDETSIHNNIFDRYILRPDEIENISLAEFAVRYETISNNMFSEEDGDIEMREPTDEPIRYIRLKDGSRMRVRNKPAVLRTRYYTLNSDKDGYYYSLIVCHIPFRDENQLMLEGEAPDVCFLRRKDELRPLLPNVSTEDFAHAEQVIQQALAQATALNFARETRSENIRDDQFVTANDHIIIEYQDDYCEDVEERGAMTDDVFFDNIRGLNIQQKDLFQRISTAVEKDLNGEDEKLMLFITGGAGSGKSFVLKLLVEHIKRCYAPTVDVLVKPKFIEVGSLTGVAARQILGKTLHSLFSLPIEKGNSIPYRRLSGQKLEQERRKWRNISWLVIDEVSMVSYENLRMINLRLQEFKNNDKLFGGVNIVLFGDIMQLPPVKGTWCFAQPPWNAAEINLWHAFSFCELTINMRQRNNIEFVDLLNNLRVGELTIGQLELLCQRRRVAVDEDFKDGVVIRIFPTVKQVDEYNNQMTSMNSKHNRVYTIRSIDESREVATYGKKPPDNVIPKDINNCGGILSELKIATESRVMLRRNIAISDGLVNGAMGIVKKIRWPSLRRDQLEEGELPELIYVKFDDESIGMRLKDIDGCVAISPVVATFQGKKGYGDIERRMLPIILCWAVTVHKLQGTTLDKAVIDLGKKVFAKGQAYVALSRVKTLEGIALSDLEPNKVLNKPHDERALAEMRRLRGLHKAYP